MYTPEKSSATEDESPSTPERSPATEAGGYVDPSVLKELPDGCAVLAVEDHGVSFWATTTCRVDVSLQDGQEASFFLKVLPDEVGKCMVKGEFESMTEIYKAVPEFVPKPLAWGTYANNPNLHFFLCEFRDMADEMPDPHVFGSLLSKLHQTSVSPTGKFGFQITTYAGNLPQYVGWEDSWETFFSKSMRWTLDLEMQRRGSTEELETLSSILFEKVIPRLLRPLESDGRSVKPSLVHGDLWYANSGIDVNTDKPLIFDACCFYAHNEYEFGQWRPACNRFGDEYVAAYKTFLKASPPEEDFEGRLDLYRLKFDTHVSALFLKSEALRPQVIEVMKDLVRRYGSD